MLSIESEQVYRNPIQNRKQQVKDICYTDEQKNAIECFWGDYQKQQYGTYLIHGVTGSGKTEVYMEMIARVAAKGRQAIVLIPEIALTFQTVMRFYRRFGDRVSIMNSRLSAGERYDQMMRAKAGEIDVMIGPRSALFTPFPNLGLIVIDEEHENTYKSEQIPRYHARETAIARAKLEQASVILGSATPSVEAMYRAKHGEYKLLELHKRSGNQEMAQVHVVDLRKELRDGNRSILSRKLQQMIADRLQKKEQIMLFLNRRGYAGFISCRECGFVVKCPHCDVSLSYHRNGKMVCHYCGYEQERVQICPECGSRHIGEFKAGTQQIEEVVKKHFPEARVLRMDLDTTRSKDGHEKILAAFANEEADILVGTQMIVKGHDFPNVTLVGILAADMSLYSNDYRAGERTFQLLTQAAGRAGRGAKKGEALIQTYSPDHYAIVTAAAQDYEAFYEEEIHYRELMGYPPVDNLLAILVSCEKEALLETGCKYLKEFAVRISGAEEVAIIGPASPGIGKINDVYRKVLYLKTEKYDTLIKMKNKFVSLLAIILGIIIIAFPMIGVIGTSSLIGLSVLLISIYLLVVGVAIIDYNKSGAIIDLILGIILLFLSLGLIFNPNLFAFLAEISLYLAGIVLIIVGVVALVNNRHARFGFYIGVSGIILGLLYIIVGTYVADPIILGTLIGLWLVITGVLKIIDG